MSDHVNLTDTMRQAHDDILSYHLTSNHVILIKTPLYTMVFILGVFGNLAVLTTTIKLVHIY